MKRFASLLAISYMLSAPLVACAGDVDDLVLLVNGGRVRGTVIEDNPQKGTTVKLADGTYRRLSASQIKEIRYSNARPHKTEPPSAPPPGPSDEEHAAAEPRKHRSRDSAHDLLVLELAEAKQNRSKGGLAMGLGFGFGAGFLVGGGVWYASADSNHRLAPIIMLVGGGLEILLGFIGVGVYAHYDGKVTDLQRSLVAKRAPASGPRRLLLDGSISAGAMPLLPPTTWVGTWSIPF